MCGIAGVSLRAGQSIHQESYAALLDALAHRGPDGQGRFVEGQQTLLHARLSIIDLENGQQPLVNNKAAIIANGEIYNDPLLRQEFATYPFQTRSDCESILPLWQQRGDVYPEKLRGMYAIALGDRQTGQILLSRDPFGIKPLYYTKTQQGIVFASEIQALLAANFVKPSLDKQALEELLQLQFTTGGKTIFQGVSRLLPGQTLSIEQGEIKQQNQIFPYTEVELSELSEKEALQSLDHALEDSVSVHERSDVPFGLFLSGGVDSTILLRMMQRLGKEKQVRCWTACFEVEQSACKIANESDQAAMMAQLVGAEHHTLSINQSMVWECLPQIVKSMDDPVADYAIIPTWLLAREAAQEVKVILSGEGGDELFGGYGRYRKASKAWWQGGRKLYHQGILNRLNILRESSKNWRNGIKEAEQNGNPHFSAFKRVQAIDIVSWLPNDLLLKLDRCLMAHGIEGRVPFLDSAVARIAAQLPDHLKVQKRKGKWLLRRWLEQELPQANPFARKQGFTVPIGYWIEGQAQRLGPLVAQQQGIQEIADPVKVMALFQQASGRRERHAAWLLLFYALWHQIYIMGQSANGNVFEVLSS